MLFNLVSQTGHMFEKREEGEEDRAGPHDCLLRVSYILEHDRINGSTHSTILEHKVLSTI